MNKEQVGIAIVLVMALFTACPTGTGTDGDAVLAAPSNLRLMGATSDSVTIGWTAVAGAVSYKVYRGAAPGGQYDCVNGAGTSDLKYADSGLSSGSTFYYKVSAVGSNGLESPQSDYVKTSTEAGPPPPASVGVTNTTKDSITITWTPVSGAAKYEIWWCLTSVGQYNKLDEAVAATYTHEGLPSAASYYYKVKALGSNGVASELSSYVKGTTKDQDGSSSVLATPTGLHVTDTTSTSVSLAWNAVSGAVSYTIYRGTSSGSMAAGTASSTAYTVTGLSANTAYNFTVSAVGTEADTESLASELVSATTQTDNVSPAVPDAPGALTVSPGDTQLTVSWTAVNGATAYEVWAGTSTDSSAATQRGSDVSGMNAVITGLTNDTPYYVWVKAKNSAGTSGFSPVASGTPVAPIVAPQAPAMPTVTAGNTQLTVSWTTVNGATAYEVWAGTSTDSSAATQRGSDVSGMNAVITGLTNDTPYYVWVKAKNSAGTSGFSPMVSGMPVAPIAAPQAPATPTVTADNTQLTVSWTAVNGATAYEVWTGTTNTSTSATKYGADITGLSATINSLTNGRTYYVWVKAKNSAGTSGFSPVASGTPRVLVEKSITIDLATQNDVTLSDQSVVISRGQSRRFQVIESYTGYQWYLNGSAISGAVAGSYTLNTASMKLGVYELSVITGAGVKLSGNCRVRVE